MKKYWYGLLILFCFSLSAQYLYAEHKDSNTPAYNQQAASQVTQSFDKKKAQTEATPPTDGIQLDIKWLPWLLVFAGVANIVLLYSRIKDRKLAEMRKQKEAQHHAQKAHPSHLSEQYEEEHSNKTLHHYHPERSHTHSHHSASLDPHTPASSKRNNHHT